MLEISSTVLRSRTFISGCLESHRKAIMREASSGNQETWGRKTIRGKGRARPLARVLVYGCSERTSFPECPGRVRTLYTRAADPAERTCARATLSVEPQAGEHRNAGRIALSPADRRSISYEYRCPWRYMTGATARGVLPKNMHRTPAYAVASHSGRARLSDLPEMSHEFHRRGRETIAIWARDDERANVCVCREIRHKRVWDYYFWRELRRNLGFVRNDVCDATRQSHDILCQRVF